jgi:hypothetical protein
MKHTQQPNMPDSWMVRFRVTVTTPKGQRSVVIDRPKAGLEKNKIMLGQIWQGVKNGLVALLLLYCVAAFATPPIPYHASVVTKGATQLVQKAVVVSTNQTPSTITLTLTQDTQYQILCSTNANMSPSFFVTSVAVPPMNVTITNNGGQMFFRARLGFFNEPQIVTNSNQ